MLRCREDGEEMKQISYADNDQSRSMDDRALMDIRAETIFTYDARGRMVGVNSPERRPAPRVFLGCTMAGRVLRFGDALSDAIVSRLRALIESQPAVEALPVAAALREEVRRMMEVDRSKVREGSGPNYRFPESIALPGHVVQVAATNIEIVRETYPWLHEELDEWWPCFAVVRDGAAVSVCFSSRIGRSAAEAGVETLPEYRGRGYAAAVTAAWGASVRADGRIPLYSTGWENLASQGVARRVGLVMFGADAMWT
jgi:hypothetical protein